MPPFPRSMDAAWLRHRRARRRRRWSPRSGRALGNAAWERVRRGERAAVMGEPSSPSTLRNASREMGEQVSVPGRRYGHWASLANPEYSVAGAQQRSPRGGSNAHHAVVFACAGGGRGRRTDRCPGRLPASGRPRRHRGRRQGRARSGTRMASKSSPVLHDDIADLAANASPTTDLETCRQLLPRSTRCLCHAQSRLYTRIFRS